MDLSFDLGQVIRIGRHTFKWMRAAPRLIIEIDGAPHAARSGVVTWRGYALQANLLTGKKMELHLPDALVPERLRGLQAAPA